MRSVVGWACRRLSALAAHACAGRATPRANPASPPGRLIRTRGPAGSAGTARPVRRGSGGNRGRYNSSTVWGRNALRTSGRSNAIRRARPRGARPRRAPLRPYRPAARFTRAGRRAARGPCATRAVREAGRARPGARGPAGACVAWASQVQPALVRSWLSTEEHAGMSTVMAAAGVRHASPARPGVAGRDGVGTARRTVSQGAVSRRGAVDG
jgi:hypothetical protein